MGESARFGSSSKDGMVSVEACIRSWSATTREKLRRTVPMVPSSEAKLINFHGRGIYPTWGSYVCS
jgi:hypothetical protein